MNKLILIGNLTGDPQLRTTQAGDAVCSFTVAVNRRRASNAQAGQPEADFFRVNVWRQLGENCAKYLSKGRKVYVSGPVQCRVYVGNDGQTRASMEVTANEVEFLSPSQQAGQGQPQGAQQAAPAPQYNGPQNSGGYTQVDEEELPF